jgi:hypothetical protein
MSLNFSSFNLDKLNKNNEKKNNSASLLSLAFCEKEDFSFFSEQKLFNYSSDESTEQSSKSLSMNNYKNNSIHKTKLKKDARKDLHGNIIKKGGKHKVSFKDEIKGKLLVEMTFYDSKESSLKSKNYKEYTINREAKDKIEMACCNIF